MFGFKPTSATLIRRDQSRLKRESNQYKRELDRIENELRILKKSLDLHTKNGNMSLAREVAGKIAHSEKRQVSLKSTINDLQKADDQAKDLQTLTSRATTQRSINSLRASVLSTIDTKEIYKIQYEAERQKDQIEMTEDSLNELFEQDEDVVEQTNSRIDELMSASLEKSVLENTIPEVSSHIPSTVPPQHLKTVRSEEHLVTTTPFPRPGSPKPSLPQSPLRQSPSSVPSVLPKPDPSTSFSSNIPSYLEELSLEERFNNLFK